MQGVSTYEVIQYPSKFFIYTHPDHLAVLGTMFGMKPQNVEKCRILELGCGNGSNLIAQSFSLPESASVDMSLPTRLQSKLAPNLRDEMSQKRIGAT